MSKLKSCARNFVDLCIFGLLCFAEFALNYWIVPWRRGFYCDDESLAYPYRPSTITLETLAIVVLTVPPLVLLSVELFQRLDFEATVKQRRGGRICRRLAACYKQLGCYLFGLVLTLLATEVVKYGTGRLRPHFFALCQPVLADGSTCDDADAQNSPRRVYHEQYKCRGSNETSAEMLLQLGQSFPSGHASIFAYAMLYVAIYLQAKLTTRASLLLKHLLQFVFVLCACFVALSRVTDHWHHWSDVLAGCLLGTSIAITVSLFVADVFGRAASQRFIAEKFHQHSFGKASASMSTPTPTLPAYTFGSVPYLSNQYGQPYLNYGYVS